MARGAVMSGIHAFLPPSGADAWRWCSLWPTMNQRFPQDDSEETKEGDAAHWVAHVYASTGGMVDIGLRAPNGVAVTDDMQAGAELWSHAIGPREGRTLYMEQKVRGTSIHPTLNDGTPDLWEFVAPRITVFDYKFGHGVVEVFENWQLLNYLALIMESLGVNNGLHDQMLSARLVVVQPRSFHRDGPIREWVIPKLSDLRGDFNQLREAAARATDPAKIAGTVGNHCKYCPGRHACQALQRNALQAVDMAGRSDAEELTPDALGFEARALRRGLKLMQARLTGLEAQGKALMMGGTRIPFMTLEEGKGRERWKQPPEVINAVGAAFGVVLEKKEVITPAQARIKGLSAEVVASLSEVPRGELKVIEDDGSKLRKFFGS